MIIDRDEKKKKKKKEEEEEEEEGRRRKNVIYYYIIYHQSTSDAKKKVNLLYRFNYIPFMNKRFKRSVRVIFYVNSTLLFLRPDLFCRFLLFTEPTLPTLLT